MRTIKDVKLFIKDNLNKRVFVKVLGIRNKNELIEGVISEIYNNIFVVSTISGKKSFTYTDILVGNILVSF